MCSCVHSVWKRLAGRAAIGPICSLGAEGCHFPPLAYRSRGQLRLRGRSWSRDSQLPTNLQTLTLCFALSRQHIPNPSQAISSAGARQPGNRELQIILAGEELGGEELSCGSAVQRGWICSCCMSTWGSEAFQPWGIIAKGPWKCFVQ